MQTYNEIQRCFLTVGLIYPEDLFMFLLNVSDVYIVSCSFGRTQFANSYTTYKLIKVNIVQRKTNLTVILETSQLRKNDE